jgi:hypothetical protein
LHRPFQNPKKNHLKEVFFISSKKFNKSATLDIESNLIKYLHADGIFRRLNLNLGIVDHSFYQRNSYYDNLFKEIWNSLISKGLKDTIDNYYKEVTTLKENRDTQLSSLKLPKRTNKDIIHNDYFKFNSIDSFISDVFFIKILSIFKVDKYSIKEVVLCRVKI